MSFTYKGSATAPTAPGNYAVIATINDANYSGTASGTLVISAATAAITFTVPNHTYVDAPFAVSASSSSTGAFTYSVISGPATISGNMVTITGAGNVTLQASQAADANYAANTKQTAFSVSKAVATVTLGSLSATYDGNAHVATATTTPSGLAVSFTYNGSATAPTSPGSYTVVATVNDSNYTGTATGTLTISSANSTIAFTVANHAYGDAPFTVSASSSSTGPFTYSVVSGNATVSGNTVTITGIGSVTLQTSQAADSNYAAATKQATFTISAAPLAITANNASRPYGASNLAFTGTITGQKYTDTFTESFTSLATPATVPGAYAIVPSIAGTNLGNYTVSPTNGTLTVTKAATTTGLSVSSTQIAPNQTVTLTVNVASTTTGVPAGTAVITDNGVALTTVTLANGAGTYSTLLFPATSHTLVATYSGDTNYVGSASSSSAVNVVVAPQEFSFATTGTGPTITAAPGTTVTYSFNVSPSFGSYPAPVSFTVTGLPAGATASFSPATLATNSGAQTVTLSVKLPQAIGKNQLPVHNNSERTATIFTMLLPLAFSRKLRRKLHGKALMAVVLLAGLTGMAALTGCGSGNGFLLQQPATYNLNVTATSGSISHTQVVTLTVQ